MIGPGRYDDIATAVQAQTQARGVILIVVSGNRGEGFECHATMEVTQALPKMLRHIADQIEADFNTGDHH
jgi:hypothetical protein